MDFPVDPRRFTVFLGAMAVLAATPGPAVMFSVANGAARGPRGVALGVSGVVCGGLCWFAAAALGLGAVMAAAPGAFAVLAWAGIAYLLWLAARQLRGAFAGETTAPHLSAERRRGGPWLSGLVVQLSNPKMVLFISTVLPPFLDARRPLPAQFLVFALAAVAVDAVGLGAYGLGGAALARRLREPGAARIFSGVSGVLLLMAALLIGVERLGR